jgi:hypothetical protein
VPLAVLLTYTNAIIWNNLFLVLSPSQITYHFDLVMTSLQLIVKLSNSTTASAIRVWSSWATWCALVQLSLTTRLLHVSNTLPLISFLLPHLPPYLSCLGFRRWQAACATPARDSAALVRARSSGGPSTASPVSGSGCPREGTQKRQPPSMTSPARVHGNGRPRPDPQQQLTSPCEEAPRRRQLPHNHCVGEG